MELNRLPSTLHKKFPCWKFTKNFKRERQKFDHNLYSEMYFEPLAPPSRKICVGNFRNFDMVPKVFQWKKYRFIIAGCLKKKVCVFNTDISEEKFPVTMKCINYT